MPPLGAQARVTARGERNPHIGFDEPLESRAWAVWFSIRNGACKSKGKPAAAPKNKANTPDLAGVPGFEVEVNLTTKMRDLWTEFAALDRMSQNAFADEVRSFLRASGNMVNVRLPGIGKGEHGQPLWWIRDTWNDVKGIPIYRPTELTSRERRLTPVEAGEDREAAPVTVSKAPQAPAAPDPLTADRDVVAKVIKEAEYPLYQTEIAERTGLTMEKTGRLVRAMLEESKPRIFRRLETREERKPGINGRFHLLYWHEPSIPSRDRSLYRLTGAFIDKVLSMKPGQTMLTRIMSPGIRREVQSLIDDGLLELINVGTEDERVRLTQEKKKKNEPASAAPSKPETKQPTTVNTAPEFPPVSVITGVVQPPSEPQSIAAELGAQVMRLVEAEVQKRQGGLARRVEELSQALAGSRAALEDERTARQQAEANLIKARTELSEVRTSLRKLIG